MRNFYLFLFLLLIKSSTVFPQWNKVEDIPSTDIYSIISDGENIYAGADSVIYISANGGLNWKPSSKITDGVDAISALIKHNSVIFAGTYVYGIFISTNEGENWQPLNNGLTGLGSKYISDFEIRGDSIYAATIGSSIFVMSLNDLSTWHPYQNNMPVSISGNADVIYNFNNKLIVGAGGNAAVYYNNYNSSVWDEIIYGSMNGEPNAMLDISSIDGILVGGSTYGVYYSTNSGSTWEFIPSEFGFINNAKLINSGSELYIYLAKPSSSRLYKFSKENFSLIPVDTQSGTFIMDAVIVNNKIYAGQISSGLWYRSLPVTSVDDDLKVEKKFSILQNFPNPFNPSTTIKYYLPVNSQVSIKIFNSIGEEIRELVNEFKSAGEYSVNFNADGLSSGVYFYNIRASGSGLSVFSETKRMVLIK